MVLIVIAITTFTLQLLLSAIVLLKDSKAAINRTFFLLSASLMLWTILAFCFNTFSSFQTVEVVRAIMFLTVMQSCFFLCFTRSLRHKQLTKSLTQRIYIITTSVVGVLILFTPYVFSSSSFNNPIDKSLIIQPSIILFFVHVLTSISLGFYDLIQKIKLSVGIRRQQTLYILIGSIILWVAVPITNLITSTLLRTTLFTTYTPFYTLIFTIIITVAIVRHRLFDIRLAIVRTIAYTMSLLALGIICTLLVFAVIRLSIGNEHISAEQDNIYLLSAVILSLAANPLKNFFGKLTKKIFFKNSYDTKHVLDKLSSVLVKSANLDVLAKKSMLTLEHAIKTDFIAIQIGDNIKQPRMLYVGDKKPNLAPAIRELLYRAPNLLLLDELEDSTSVHYQLMHQNNVAAIIKLKTSQDIVGHLLIGHKQNGNAFTNQDINLVKIAADELSVAIQNALRFEKINHFNETLQQEIDVATKELRKNNEKLKALDEAKDEFISMASHQLRTPLTSVKGYLSMVLEGDGGKLNADQNKLLQEAYSSTQRMVYMISDFLNVSRIKTGRFLIEPSSVNLAKVVKQELTQVMAATTNRHLVINAQISNSIPTLKLDDNKIRQVIMNLIDNAIFYSKSGGTVYIELSKVNDKVMFQVSDQGIGVPLSEQSRLFTKFFRASNARHVRPDGTGVGLFMAQKVITAHGGETFFISAEGKGSTFGFSIPLASNLTAKSKAKL